MNVSQRSRRALRIAWVLTLFAILVGSLLPNSSPPMRLMGWLHLQDKLQHLAGYAVAALLPAVHERRRPLAAIVLGLVGFGVLMEFAQTLTVDRSFEVRDIIADAVGVLFGLILGLTIRAGMVSEQKTVTTLMTSRTAKPVPDGD